MSDDDMTCSPRPVFAAGAPDPAPPRQSSGTENCLELTNPDGTGMRLSIAGYEWTGGDTDEEEALWDEWLLVHVAADSSEGAWEFTKGILGTEEVWQLLQWLVRAGLGNLPTIDEPDDDMDRPGVWPLRGLCPFDEPDITFSLKSSSDEVVVLRCHFGHRGLPPWLSGERTDWSRYGFTIEVAIDTDELLRRADAFRPEAARWPARSQQP